jgi:integrase
MSDRVRVETGVFRRPDGKLEIGWRDAAGKQRWRVVEGGIKAARAARSIEVAKRTKGELVAAAPRLTFRAAADSWWEVRATRRTKPQSQRTYRRALDLLIDEFGTMRLSAITPATLADYIAREQAAGAKGWTLKQRIAILSGIYRNATRRLGYVGTNPATMLDSAERPTSTDATPKRVLSDDELSTLLEAIAPQHRLIFELMAQTGLRISEARGLIWANVDLAGSMLTVDAQLSRFAAVRVQTKTPRSMRTIAISPTLVGKLREHLLATGRPDVDEFVFRHMGGRGAVGRQAGTSTKYVMQPYSSGSVSSLMQRARERAKLDPIERNGELIARAPVPHDLRHTHASKLIAAGWDVAEVAARLGDSIQTVLSTYAHEWDAVRRRKDQRDRLEALYGSAMEASDVSQAQ